MPPFAYFAPSTVPEAVALLSSTPTRSPAQPGRLVGLRRVAGLDGIRMEGDVLVLARGCDRRSPSAARR